MQGSPHRLLAWLLIGSTLAAGMPASLDVRGLTPADGGIDTLADAIAQALDVQSPTRVDAASSPPALVSMTAADAARALVARHGGQPSATALVAAVEQMAAPQQAALAPVLASFLGLEDAAAEAFAVRPPTEGALAHALAARADLLRAVAALRLAMPAPVPDGAVQDGCPALALDLAGQDSTYPTDCALIVDLGGNDHYRNNAGGTAGGVLAGGFAAAAVVDLAGDDTYGDPTRERLGVIGGGNTGVGLVVDDGGNDTYGLLDTKEMRAAYGLYCVRTGGGDVDCAGHASWTPAEARARYEGGDAVGLGVGRGVSCIVKADGNVDCRAADARAIDFDYVGGDAVRVRVAGSHVCVLTRASDVRCQGTNTYGQVAQYLGGDAVGLDAAEEHTCVVKASGDVACWGLNNLGQSDPYLGGDAVDVAVGSLRAPNGAAVQGRTCVLTRGGDVRCRGDTTFAYLRGDAVAVAVGSDSARVCALSSGGNVTCSTEGGWRRGDARGVGIGYTGEGLCVLTQLGTVDCIPGQLTEADTAHYGNDRGANGGALDGVGLLLDHGGNDVYAAGASGTNGGASDPGLGLLLDTGGDDHYRGGMRASNGGTDGFFHFAGGAPFPSAAALFDMGGHDIYEDWGFDGSPWPWACWDCSVFPKGVQGIQSDGAGIVAKHPLPL